MTCFAISLRGLRHPLTLTSIGLLLLNDHVLKAAMPSALTGKLSDLAGLFFFPFLLAALLSLPLDRLRVPSRRTAALAFGMTLVWFTLIKTWPWANAAMVASLTALLGLPVQIVRDPTDLLALVVLWPVWRLWIHLEQIPSHQPPGKVAYVALGLASLATLATSPCIPQPSVTRLVIFEQSVYAGLTYASNNNSQYPGTLPQVARSNDGGKTWVNSAAPGQVTQPLAQPASLPVTVCDPENPQTCYRVTGANETVEGSSDGGQTWRVVWQVPWGRRKFMEAYLSRAPLSCKRKLDLGPYDLVLLPQHGAHTLIVAMGNEGVLVRTSEGAWQRYAVMQASSTPYAAQDFWSLLWPVLYESGIAWAVATLAGLAFCVLGWGIILFRAHLPPGRTIWWAIAPAIWGAVILLLACPLACLLSILVPGLSWLLVISVVGLVAVVVLALTWWRVASLSYQRQMASLAAATSALAPAAILLLVWMPFPLWAFGVIPAYEIALALSVLAGLVSLACAGLGVGWASYKAAQTKSGAG